jgi:hypothetical protein
MEQQSDHWLLTGIRQCLGNHIKVMKCGSLLQRYHIMKKIEKVYKMIRQGSERYPLNSEVYPDMNDIESNDFTQMKCELIMHMIESMIDKNHFRRILSTLFTKSAENDFRISTKIFKQTYKEICGLKLNQFI